MMKILKLMSQSAEFCKSKINLTYFLPTFSRNASAKAVGCCPIAQCCPEVRECMCIVHWKSACVGVRLAGMKTTDHGKYFNMRDFRQLLPTLQLAATWINVDNNPSKIMF